MKTKTPVLACRLCGVPVADPPLVVDLYPARREYEPGMSGEAPERMIVQVSVCPTCAAIEAMAADMTEALDERTRQRLGGGRQVVEGRIVAALVALAVVRGRLPRTMTPDDVREMVAALAVAGSGMAWQSRLVPTLRAVRPPTEPWGHVGEETRQAARTAYAGLLAKSVHRQRAAMAGPVRLTPPERPRAVSTLVEAIDGGCALCGVGSVEWPAERVEAAGGERAARMSAWTMHTVEGTAIGRRWPKLLSIWLCPTCDESGESGDGLTFSLGPRVVERAWSMATVGEVAFVDPTPTTWAALVLRARRAERREPEPNAAPWQHYVNPEPVGREAS